MTEQQKIYYCLLISGWAKKIRNFFFVAITVIGAVLSVAVLWDWEKAQSVLGALLIILVILVIASAITHWQAARWAARKRNALKNLGELCPLLNILVSCLRDRINEAARDVMGKAPRHDVILYGANRADRRASHLTVLAATDDFTGMEMLRISVRNRSDCQGIAGRCWKENVGNDRKTRKPECSETALPNINAVSATTDEEHFEELVKQYALETGMSEEKVREIRPRALRYWAFPILISGKVPWGVILIRSDRREKVFPIYLKEVVDPDGLVACIENFLVQQKMGNRDHCRLECSIDAIENH